jgi:hypothetical protein
MFHFFRITRTYKQIKNNIFKPTQNFFNQILKKKIDLQALQDSALTMALKWKETLDLYEKTV